MSAPPTPPASATANLSPDLADLLDGYWRSSSPLVWSLAEWVGTRGWVALRSAKVTDAPRWPEVRDGADETRVAVAATAAAWASLGWRAEVPDLDWLGVWFGLNKVLGGIRFRKGAVTAPQARLLCRLAGRERGEGVAIAACKAYLGTPGLGPEGLDVVRADIEDLLARLAAEDGAHHDTSIPGLFGAGYVESADLAKRRAQLHELLGVGTAARAGDGPGEPGVPAYDAVVPGTDATAGALRDHLAAADPTGLGALLGLLRRPPGGTVPSKRWRTSVADAVAAAPAAPAFLEAAADLAADAELRAEAMAANPQSLLFDPSTQDLLRGVAWALAGSVEHPEARLERLARRCGERVPGVGPPAPKVCTAAVHALASRGTREAVASLGVLQRRLKNPSLLKQVDKALEAAAAEAGVTALALQEQAVPDLGFDASGARRFAIGDGCSAVATLVAGGGVQVAWVDAAGTESAKPPAAWKTAHGAAVRSVAAALKAVREALADERFRQEQLLAADPTWTFDDWAAVYRDHPVASAVAAGLLWVVVAGPTTTVAQSAPDGTLRDLAGAPVTGAESLRLWHPIESAPDEVEAWRARLLDTKVSQAFKQAHREVYLLTPAEEASGDRSSRFAGHVVDARLLYVLTKERHWAMPRLGGWSGGYEAAATRPVPGTDLTAELWVVASEDGGFHGADTGLTGDLRFVRGTGAQAVAVPLADVPPRAFSETLRDLDLFVSRCSLMLSPDWMTAGAEADPAARLAALDTPIADVRRAALERLLPGLRIADRCRVDGTHLHVRGTRRSYRIHIASGHVFRDPGSRYLCIVPRSTGPARNVFLPFDDDATLTVILSKAFLLADDEAITDPDILAQLDR